MDAPHIPAAKAIYYYDSPVERRILVLQVSYTASFGQEEYLDVPGGQLEAGEDTTAALIRELREEIGVTVAPEQIAPQVVCVDTWLKGGTTQTIRAEFFAVKALTPDITVGEQKFSARWVNELEVAGLDIPDIRKHAFAKVLQDGQTSAS